MGKKRTILSGKKDTMGRAVKVSDNAGEVTKANTGATALADRVSASSDFADYRTPSETMPMDECVYQLKELDDFPIEYNSEAWVDLEASDNNTIYVGLEGTLEIIAEVTPEDDFEEVKETIGEANEYRGNQEASFQGIPSEDVCVEVELPEWVLRKLHEEKVA